MAGPDLGFDFDAAWAEIDTRRPAPFVKVRGTTYDLPRGMPAKVVLDTERRRLDPEAATRAPTVTEMVGMLADLDIPADDVLAWVDDGLTVDRLMDVYLLAQALIRAWLAGDRPDAEGEAVPPATGDSPETPSPDGPSSKATGDASSTDASSTTSPGG